MKKLKIKNSLFSFILSIGVGVNMNSQAVFIGPMIHYNFGGGTRTFSYGVEASYWTNLYYDQRIEETGPPWGFDIGFEFGKNKKSFYSEIQVGSVFGISNGVIMLWSKEAPFKLGYQGSAWFVFFGGADARVRIFKDEKIYSPGIMVKLPLYFLNDIKYF
jgi:hypothetical protein